MASREAGFSTPKAHPLLGPVIPLLFPWHPGPVKHYIFGDRECIADWGSLCAWETEHQRLSSCPWTLGSYFKKLGESGLWLVFGWPPSMFRLVLAKLLVGVWGGKDAQACKGDMGLYEDSSISFRTCSVLGIKPSEKLQVYPGPTHCTKPLGIQGQFLFSGS